MANRALFTLLGLAVGGYLLYRLSPILTPFLVSAMLAYIADPLVDRLQRRRLSRLVAVIIVFIGLTAALLIALLALVPLLEQQVRTFIEKLPGYVQYVQTVLLPALEETLGVSLSALDAAALRERLLAHWESVGGWLGSAVGVVTASGAGILAWSINLLLIPVVTFYLLLDWDTIVARIHALIPPRYQQKAGQLARETDEVLGSFLRGQLLIMLALGIMYSVGLLLVGLDLAVPIGMLAGLVSFVPYLGVIVGIVVAGAAAALQFKAILPLLGVAVVFGAGQLVEGMVLQPRLMGSRLGLHPVAVIFAVLAGGQLFGFFGVLLALPVAAMVMVWLRHLHEFYRLSDVYNRER